MMFGSVRGGRVDEIPPGLPGTVGADAGGVGILGIVVVSSIPVRAGGGKGVGGVGVVEVLTHC